MSGGRRRVSKPKAKRRRGSSEAGFQPPDEQALLMEKGLRYREEIAG
jgi:hypothetical protein